MRLELEFLGKDVHFLIVNATSALDDQQKLIDETALPMFQDQENVDVWSLMDGNKDDFYVFDSDGNLAHFLPISGDASVNLSEEEGYQNLLDAVLSTQ